MGEIGEIKQAYDDATELLLRLANVLENGLLHSARRDGATALGLSGWLLSGLNENVLVKDAVGLVLALTILVEEDVCSQALRDGACALRMGARLVNTLFSGAGGKDYIQIRDDLICWSDFVEMNVFPHRNNGPAALRLAIDLLKLTMCLM